MHSLSGGKAELYGTEVIRTADYSARLLDLLAKGRRRYNQAARMEADLVSAEGYPSDSLSVRQHLALIAADEWQEVVNMFELINPGNALLALTYIEQQRL